MIEKIKKGEVICITGAGGKTSLMFFLAEKLSKKGKVLITTTTKIYIPEKNSFEKMYIDNLVVKGDNKNIFIEGKSTLGNKIIGISYKEIEKRKENYDYILIEADGAKEKILKGWNEKEPCIPEIATMTIGIVNIKSIGKRVEEENIHRLDLFCRLTKGKKGELINLELLENYIKTGNFFKDSNFQNIIYLNGVETLEELKMSMKLGEKIKDLYFGSIWDSWITKVKSIDAVIMASGYSKRFKGEKLFEELGGISLIEKSLKRIIDIPFNKVIVVGRDIRVKKLAKKYNYEYIENKKAHLGQSESVKLGAANSTGDAVMFFSGDQPFLTGENILTLIKEYEKKNQITRPIVDEIPFSPVIFPSKYINLLLKLEGDNGGKEVIKKVKLVCKVNFIDKKEFMDIDTREELKEVKKVISSKKYT